MKLFLEKLYGKKDIGIEKTAKMFLESLILSSKKQKIALFCDSKFRHGYDWGHQKQRIGTHSDFWIKKIGGNIERDKKVNNTLKTECWTVLRFWEDEIKDINKCVQKIENCINNSISK